MVEKGTTLVHLKERLLDITKYCPTEILKAVRKPYKGLSVKNINLEQDLIFLDHLIEVPTRSIEKENTDILDFENVILDFIEVLVHIIENKKPEEFSFNITSVGSFPLNLKILAIDEFDIILPLIKRTNNFHKLYNDFIRGNNNNTQPMEELGFYEIFETTIYELTKSDGIKNVEISGPYHTGPAVNIELSWKCSGDHDHKVSLDFTIAVETDRTVNKYVESKLLHLKDSPFNRLVEKLKDDRNDYMYITYNNNLLEYFDTTNLFDPYMFSICDSISINIKICYRILKFIRDVLFPHNFIERWNVSGKSRYVLDQSVSSHLLKHVLFNEVIQFPQKEHWNENKICARISSMLTCLTDVKSDSYMSTYDIKELKLRDCFTQSDMFMRKDTFLLLEIINKELQVFLQTENLSKNYDECTISNCEKGVFLTVKGWMFNLFKNDDKCLTRNRDDGFYLTVNGWMFKVDTSKIHNLIDLFAAKIPIMKIHELGSDILESEFAKFINKYYLTLTEERFLLDVTSFTPEMTLKIIGLFKVGVIVSEDFTLQSYMKKIEKFETFCKVCEIEVSWALREYAGNSYRMRETTRKTETWMKKVYSDLTIIFKSAGINDIGLVHKHLKEWPGKIQYDDCRNNIDNLIQEVIEEAEPNPINSIQWFWLQLLMESIRDTQCIIDTPCMKDTPCIKSSLSMNPVSLPLKFMRFPQFLCGCLICLFLVDLQDMNIGKLLLH